MSDNDHPITISDDDEVDIETICSEFVEDQLERSETQTIKCAICNINDAFYVSLTNGNPVTKDMKCVCNTCKIQYYSTSTNANLKRFDYNATTDQIAEPQSLNSVPITTEPPISTLRELGEEHYVALNRLQLRPGNFYCIFCLTFCKNMHHSELHRYITPLD